MKWYNAESDTKPLEVDDTSCPQLVYFRRNVQEVKTTDPETKAVTTKYTYEEMTVSRENYEAMMAATVSPMNTAIMQTLSNIEVQNELMAIMLEAPTV